MQTEVMAENGSTCNIYFSIDAVQIYLWLAERKPAVFTDSSNSFLVFLLSRVKKEHRLLNFQASYDGWPWSYGISHLELLI